MQSNIATNLSPITSENKKVEVSLENDQAFIKLSSWFEGLGWCGQKTLQIDAEMLDDLHRAITSARYKINKQKSTATQENTPSKIIDFPIFS